MGGAPAPGMPMNPTTRSIAILCAVSLACATGALAQAPYVPAAADTFYDDFSAGIVDPAKWYAANKNWGGKVNGEDYNGGVVPSNFRQVEAPQIYCMVLNTLTGGSQFTNTADVGGVYDGQWIMAADRWVTKVYAPVKPLPRTGY